VWQGWARNRDKGTNLQIYKWFTVKEWSITKHLLHQGFLTCGSRLHLGSRYLNVGSRNKLSEKNVLLDFIKN